MCGLTDASRSGSGGRPGQPIVESDDEYDEMRLPSLRTRPAGRRRGSLHDNGLPTRESTEDGCMSYDAVKYTF